MKRYRAFDLIVDSAFDLPGAVGIDTGADEPDIFIESGNAALTDATAALGPYRLAGDTIEFTAPGVGRYLIRAGGRITVEMEPGGDAAMLVPLLLATAVPAALWMRGDMAIHACAAVPSGSTGAIAVTAPSGGGKSTLLAQWAKAGAGVVADDVVRLSMAIGVVTASGLPGGCFFPVGQTDDREFLSFPPQLWMDRAPLSALVQLQFAQGPPALERMDPVSGLELLLAARHRPKVPTLLRKNAALLNSCGLLARKVAMYRLTVERDGANTIVDRLASLATSNCTEI